MPAPPVVNASPAIVLAKVGHLALLRLAGDPVLVPRTVEQEILAGGTNDPAAQALGQTTWLQVVDPGPVPAELQPYGLDAGGNAVLTWARAHPGTEVLLDDPRARRCAASFAIPHRGTVALVIEARRQGLVPAARPILEHLRQVGLYLSDRVMNHALAQVGE